MIPPRKIAFRWTIGDVSPFGFEALYLSVWGAWRLFGPEAAYTVCVNTLAPEKAIRRAGPLPATVRWHASTRDQIPAPIARHLNTAMAEGVGWKFAPLRLHPDRYELALDNDCILWDCPLAIRQWLELADPARGVIAEDVRPGFGQFADLCDPKPRNSGIRGIGPAFDLERALAAILTERPVTLASELDEQGLQVAALHRFARPWVVSSREVTICSPFPPHVPWLGPCGAHFVGLNARSLPWHYYDRSAAECLRDHWQACRDGLYARVTPPRRGTPPPGRRRLGRIQLACALDSWLIDRTSWSGAGMMSIQPDGLHDEDTPTGYHN